MSDRKINKYPVRKPYTFAIRTPVPQTYIYKRMQFLQSTGNDYNKQDFIFCREDT